MVKLAFQNLPDTRTFVALYNSGELQRRNAWDRVCVIYVSTYIQLYMQTHAHCIVGSSHGLNIESTQ